MEFLIPPIPGKGGHYGMAPQWEWLHPGRVCSDRLQQSIPIGARAVREICVRYFSVDRSSERAMRMRSSFGKSELARM